MKRQPADHPTNNVKQRTFEFVKIILEHIILWNSNHNDVQVIQVSPDQIAHP
jgi:hypothetical protein